MTTNPAGATNTYWDELQEQYGPDGWGVANNAGSVALAAANTFTAQQKIYLGGAVNQEALSVGTGAARGAPTGTITAVTNGAGTITATRRWAYTEIDGIGGETTLSPASSSLVLSAQQAKLTVPNIRPGMVDRKIYASDDGGTTWKLVGNVNSNGDGYYNSVYLDNIAAPTATAPTVDTTTSEQLTVNNDGMIYMRRTNNVDDADDLTVLMANPANSSSLSIDLYGQLMVRGGGTAGMGCFTARTKGTASSSPFQAMWSPDDGSNTPVVQTFRVAQHGATSIVGNGIDWGGPGLRVAPTVAQTTATDGLINVVVPTGSTNQGEYIDNAGSGYGLNILQAGAGTGLHVSSSAGQAGHWLAQFVGQDYGVNVVTSGNQSALSIIKSGTGSGTVLAITNSGTGAIIDTGKGKILSSGQWQPVSANEATGSASAALGSNCPATTATAPYTWEKITTSDGSQGYIPVWK